MNLTTNRIAADKLICWQRLCCLLAGALLLFPASADAQSNYYKHLLFDNSLTPERYFYSEGKASEPSRLSLDKGKLPVETKTFFTAPNALRLQWQSARDGGWEAALHLERFRNRAAPFDGDTLYFWCFSPKAIPASHLPRIELKDSDGGFTAPLDIERFAGDVPAGRWVQMKLPLRSFTNASLSPFNPHKLQTVFFLQGTADGAEHALIIDEVKIDFADTVDKSSPTAPKSLRARGYERHVELIWQPNTEAGLQRYVIYRSFDGATYEQIGIQQPRINRFTDFLGEPNRKAFYKIRRATAPTANLTSPNWRQLPPAR